MIKKILIGFCLAVVVFSSCSDDDSLPAQGHITDGGKKIPLFYATTYLREKFGEETVYTNEIVISGEYGNTIHVFLYSDNLRLKSGTYSFTGNQFEINSISSCEVTLKHRTDSYVSRPESEGTFVISVSGQTYTFDMDVTIDGQNIKLHYKGEVFEESAV